MGSSGKRRSSRRSASKAVIPATVEKDPENIPATSPNRDGSIYSFFGSKLARPALIGNPDQSVKKLLETNNTRLHFVSSVQPLMEWAAGAQLKDGGVAPQWIGRAPRKPMTAARVHLEDLREIMLAKAPSLRLMPRREQLRVVLEMAVANGEPATYSDLSKERQDEYVHLAAVDQRRYDKASADYERTNPGWKAFQIRSHKSGATHGRPKQPPAPLNAQHIFQRHWLQTKGLAAQATKELTEAALKEWKDMECEQRQLYESEAADAEQKYEAAMVEWKRQCDERRSHRRALKTRSSKDAHRSSPATDAQSVSDSESSGDEVAAERWGAHTHTAKPLSTEACEASLPADTAVGGFRATATQGSEDRSEGQAMDPQGSNIDGSTGRATRSGRAPPGRPPSGHRSAVKQTSKDANKTESPSQKQPTPKAAAAPPLPLSKASNNQEAIQNAVKRTERFMQKQKSKRPAAFPTDPIALIGAAISDTFLNENNKRQVFSGKVTKFEFARITGQGLTPLWEVVFEDGDCGEKEWHELKDTLVTWPPPSM